MPFQDDTGVRPEEQRGPLLSAFAILWDQIERMVALNVVWAAQLLPLLGALGFPTLPAALRIVLFAYTAIIIAPATGTLFGALWEACDQELLSVELVRATFRRLAVPSVTVLAPLYSLFVWLALAATWAADRGWLWLDTAARLLFLLLGVCAMYWGPLFAAGRTVARSPWTILRASVTLVWRRPLLSCLLSLAVVLVLAIGLFSVGGVFLIAPVLIALLQIQHYRHIA